jgi:hypothetical protein
MMKGELRLVREWEKEAREILALPDTPVTRRARELAANDLRLAQAMREMMSNKKTKKGEVRDEYFRQLLRGTARRLREKA